MPNTSPNSPAPSQNASTCPEDSAPTTTAWPDDDDDGASGSWAARAGDAVRRSSPSPSPSMPDLVPADGRGVLAALAASRDGRDSPATERSATLSPGDMGSRGTPAPEENEGENEEGPGGDADSVRWRSPERVEGVGLGFRDGDCSAVSMGPDYSSLRAVTTSPSSYLRPGTRFQGAQSSERQKYIVSVEIKHVDLRDSFLCGYLRIQDLTEDHPTLTTYFEGEILGQKHTFTTPHPSWGATPKDDLSHWSKFAAFRPYARAARKGPVFIRDPAQQEHIFMRWKEQFLVPDHRVTTIRGASFEGFYYICFNQVKGEVSGIYFHSKSERFQQLELKHVEDRGCFPAVEFR